MAIVLFLAAVTIVVLAVRNFYLMSENDELHGLCEQFEKRISDLIGNVTQLQVEIPKRDSHGRFRKKS